MHPGDQSDVGPYFISTQKLLPQTDGRPGNPQSHLSPFRRLKRLLAEERLLPALRQREHRHLRAGDGQARHQVAASARAALCSRSWRKIKVRGVGFVF